MNTGTERRSELRLDEQATVFIEFYSADDEASAAPRVLICNSLDISANGIQIQIDQEVAVGSILRIGAELEGNEQALYLVGEVRWIKPADDGFTIGFALYDAENTDIIGWKALIAGRLGA